MQPVKNQIRNCPSNKCGYTTNENVVNCPKCQRRMRPAKQMRRLGWILASLGLFLVALPGVLIVYLAPSLLHPRAAEYQPVFNGTAEQGRLALELFGALILFGLNATVGGIFQIKTGRRNIWIFILGAALLAVLLGVGVAFSKAYDSTHPSAAVSLVATPPQPPSLPASTLPAAPAKAPAPRERS
jgi:hypothetical protein